MNGSLIDSIDCQWVWVRPRLFSEELNERRVRCASYPNVYLHEAISMVQTCVSRGKFESSIMHENLSFNLWERK